MKLFTPQEVLLMLNDSMLEAGFVPTEKVKHVVEDLDVPESKLVYGLCRHLNHAVEERNAPRILSEEEMEKVRVNGWSIWQILQAQNFWKLHHGEDPK